MQNLFEITMIFGLVSIAYIALAVLENQGHEYERVVQVRMRKEAKKGTILILILVFLTIATFVQWIISHI